VLGRTTDNVASRTLSCNSVVRVYRVFLLKEKGQEAHQYRGFSGADRGRTKSNERGKGTSKVQSIRDNKKPPVLPRGFSLREQDSNRLRPPQSAQFSQISRFRVSMSSICSMSYTTKGTIRVQWTETDGTRKDVSQFNCSSKISAPKEASSSGRTPLLSAGRSKPHWKDQRRRISLRVRQRPSSRLPARTPPCQGCRIRSTLPSRT
jgi:hypothetical protein